MTPARSTTGPDTLARIRSCPGPMFCSTPVISTSKRSSFDPSKTVSPYPCMPLRTCENGMVLVVAADAAADTMLARATEMARRVRGTGDLTRPRNNAISLEVTCCKMTITHRDHDRHPHSLGRFHHRLRNGGRVARGAWRESFDG